MKNVAKAVLLVTILLLSQSVQAKETTSTAGFSEIWNIATNLWSQVFETTAAYFGNAGESAEGSQQNSLNAQTNSSQTSNDGGSVDEPGAPGACSEIGGATDPFGCGEIGGATDPMG